MDSLKQNFQGVRDMVFLSATGISCQAENQLRLGLRKKNIRLQMVKNSLTRRVFDEFGITFSKPWQGPTILAWGADSVADPGRAAAFEGADGEGILHGADDDAANRFSVSPDFQAVAHFDPGLGSHVQRKNRCVHVGDQTVDFDAGILLDLPAE